MLGEKLTAPLLINPVEYVWNLEISRKFVGQPTVDSLPHQRQEPDISSNDAIVIVTV